MGHVWHRSRAVLVVVTTGEGSLHPLAQAGAITGPAKRTLRRSASSEDMRVIDDITQTLHNNVIRFMGPLS